MRKIAAFIVLLFVSGLAVAQTATIYSYNLPSTCNSDRTRCITALTVVNPDGSFINPSAGRAVTGALTSGSGTLAQAGISQQVFAANPTRAYLFCQNPTDATEKLAINIGAAASPTSDSYELAAGGTVTFAVGFVPNGTVTINAATVGHRFICKQAG